MSSTITTAKHNLYADDTAVHQSGPDINTIKNKLQHDLNSISKWCDENRLTINTQKTKVMIFGTHQKLKKTQDPELKIGE